MDSAAQAEFSALREELQKTLEKSKEKTLAVGHSSELHQELQQLQEQVTALWRQTGNLVDEMQVLSPTVKQDLLRWKLSISAQVSEHEGRLKCLAETAGTGSREEMSGRVSDELLLLRKELHNLRENSTAAEVAERLDEVSKSAASSKQEIAHLREELQKLPSEQEAEHSEASRAAGPKAATPEVQTLHESEEMASSRGEFSKLQEEV